MYPQYVCVLCETWLKWSNIYDGDDGNIASAIDLNRHRHKYLFINMIRRRNEFNGLIVPRFYTIRKSDVI
jgi:hypothetical protein